VYSSEYQKKDSSFDLSSITSYPSKISNFYFKNGNWKQTLDTSFVEYQYFDHTLKQQFYKLRGLDTLLYMAYDKRTDGQDSMPSVTMLYNTDTVLGRQCNRLILHTSKLKLTFIYSSSIKVNPAWFNKTQGGYYDIIYGKMKSLYIKLIVESDHFITIQTAVKIIPRTIPDTIFPDISKIPYKELQ
jgi:hypothetical protein